ncbi:hypA-like protein [Aspergillus terreus]|uniref:HypA-like protein n=1 Tax=Aspergillus terreus TaxID=33178 RepID=A0A5M3ZAU3_ASPTE|nr:hypothetical protein ATETN484_0013013100 [Aspergillus terreus]GFF20365.1 hypA-like protein [Aspergillus terreus]
MATATRIQLSPSDTGVYSFGVREDSARVASELLQKNMEKHHIYFNDRGFHNHIVHHLLSIYALGATPAQLQDAYDRNKTYQRPAMPTDEKVVESLRNDASFEECLGKEENYPNFLAFFQRKINEKGVESVLNKYLFSGTGLAEQMFVRLFEGLIHPLIHLGFGVEFSQPAIIAEALAQAAVHRDRFGHFFHQAETKAGGIGQPGGTPLPEIVNQIRSCEKLAQSAHWEDPTRIHEGVLIRGLDEMVDFAAKFRVPADSLQMKAAEMISNVVYYTAAAQQPGKQAKFDFFFMHGVNSSIFFPKLMSLSFVDVRYRQRLLEWKGRLDLLLYVGGGAPPVYDAGRPKRPQYAAATDLRAVFAHSVAHPQDDGHLPKLVRALLYGQQVCAPFANDLDLPVKEDDWLKIVNMVCDSTAYTKPVMWIRGAGFQEAWADVEDVSKL